MKKTVYTLLILTTIINFSCSDFLAEDPQSIISEDQFYKTPTDALNAVNATYFFYNGGGSNGSTQTAYNSLLQIGMEFATDEQYPGPGAVNADVRSFRCIITRQPIELFMKTGSSIMLVLKNKRSD